MKKILLLAAVALTVPASAWTQDVMTPETLWNLKRVGGPVVSPDGSRILYTVREYDITANRGNTDLYLLSIRGGEPIRLTHSPGSEFNARWRPDGQKIGFLSAESGSVQLWEMNPDGSNRRQVTNIDGGIGNFSYAPDGEHVAFTRNVKLDATVTNERGQLRTRNLGCPLSFFLIFCDLAMRRCVGKHGRESGKQ